jgi:hypothetical protein
MKYPNLFILTQDIFLNFQNKTLIQIQQTAMSKEDSQKIMKILKSIPFQHFKYDEKSIEKSILNLGIIFLVDKKQVALGDLYLSVFIGDVTLLVTCGQNEKSLEDFEDVYVIFF